MSKLKIVTSIGMIMLIGLLGYVLVKGKAGADVILPPNSDSTIAKRYSKLLDIGEKIDANKENWTIVNNNLYSFRNETKIANKYSLAYAQNFVVGSQNIPIWPNESGKANVMLATNYQNKLYIFVSDQTVGGAPGQTIVKVYRLVDDSSWEQLGDAVDNVVSPMTSDNFWDSNRNKIAISSALKTGGNITQSKMIDFDFITGKWSDIGTYSVYDKGNASPFRMSSAQGIVRSTGLYGENIFFSFGGGFGQGTKAVLMYNQDQSPGFEPTTIEAHNYDSGAVTSYDDLSRPVDLLGSRTVYLFGSNYPTTLDSSNKVTKLSYTYNRSEKYDLNQEQFDTAVGKYYPAQRISDMPLGAGYATSAKTIGSKIYLIFSINGNMPSGSPIYYSLHEVGAVTPSPFISQPYALPITVNASSYILRGTAIPGDDQVTVYRDINNDDKKDGDPVARQVKVDGLGNWWAKVELTPNADNNFVATETSKTKISESPPTDVPTITEKSSVSGTTTNQ